MRLRVGLSIAAAPLLALAALAQTPRVPNSQAASRADPPVTPPAQAANAGLTTMLVNQDFSRGTLDLGCAGQSQKHFWNQGADWEKPPAPCDQIGLVYDPVAGQKVLDLKWRASQTDRFDATLIETMAYDHSQYYGFNHGYYEAIFRAVPINVGGVWPGFWTIGANAVTFANLPPRQTGAPAVELDVVEMHGESPGYVSSGIHEWGIGNSDYMYHGNVAGLDYTRYHKYGMLWTRGGENQSGQICMYVDDVRKGCTTADAPAEYQRHFLVLSLVMGCQWKLRDRSCINVPVTSVADNGWGAVRLTVGSTAGFKTGHMATISGVNGIAGANGVFEVTVIDPTHLDLTGSTFAGTYNGGGTINALAEADMYVKSVRVWSCAEDAANAC
jgi:hypothetical protein